MRGKVLQKIFPALGTVNTITLYDSFAPAIAEQVKKRVLDLHRRFSLFKQGSDIFRINAGSTLCCCFQKEIYKRRGGRGGRQNGRRK